jgi:leader peptidase (prepilin peptidase)/N-methyltransferase
LDSSETAAAIGRHPAFRGALVALGTTAAVAAAARAGLHFEAVLAAAFVAVLTAASIVDLEERRIPNGLVLPATAIALLAQGLLHTDRFVECVVAGVGAAALFLAAKLVSRNAVGMGDVKLVLLIGVILGKSVLDALLVAGVAGAIVGIALIASNGLGARKQAIPYAPVLALGAVTTLLLGSSPLYS